MTLFLLSVTASAAADGTCDLHYRWNDGSESSANQGDVLAVYTASAKHRAAGAKAEYPHSNSQEWCAWALDYANRYDAHYAAPPEGYVAPVVEAVPAPAAAGQTSLFPSGGDGIPAVTDPRALRRAALEAMDPVDYKAAAKAVGVVAKQLKKAALIEAILVAEFDKPAAPTVEAAPAPQAAPAVVEAPVVVAAPAPKAEKAPKAKKAPKVVEAPAPVEPAPAPVEKAPKAKKAPKAAPVPAGDIVAQDPGVIVDGDTRVEVGGEVGLGGGSGIEMGGGMGLGGGVELGGSIGTKRGAGELTGGLTGESSAGMGGEGRDATPGGIKKRAGAGCKQPDKVDGWEAGRVLVVLKPHRGEHKAWGTCEYRVKCENDGTYTLVKLTGNRKATDLGNLFEGKHWDYVSPMLTDLMGIPRDSEGKPAFHHRMTIRRWFALGRAQ